MNTKIFRRFRKLFATALATGLALAAIAFPPLVHAENVITKGGGIVTLNWANRANATNTPNFGRSAVLRVIAPDGTNNFGIDTNATPFFVGGTGGPTNYANLASTTGVTGQTVDFTNVVNHGGVMRLRFYKGLLVSTN